MCGILGIVDNTRHGKADKDIIKRMCSVIQHRGPDHTGIWCEGRVGLGMTRLSIIDIVGGFQPIHNEDKSIWIVFNGEIYNFKLLRKELEILGHKFYTDSDTEVIIHLYEEYGDGCVEKLRGMFVFAIWDIRKERLFISRDRLGIKPLHYFFNGKQIVFGSEIKSILKSGLIQPKVDYQALVYYFFYGYTPDPNCMFREIKKLPPGHTLVFHKGKITVRQYWDVTYVPDYQHDEEYFIDRSIEIMREAVRIRLMSEVPLGAFLSGGVDSSLVVALMALEMSEPVKTFSIGFEEQSYDELRYARMVAEKYQTDHHEEIVRPDAEEVILKLVHQFDEPFADSSAIPTFYVSKMTKNWVTVSLSGDGGDELYGGYNRYREGWLAKWASFMPASLKTAFWNKIVDKIPFGCLGFNTYSYLSLGIDEQIIWKYTKMLSPFHRRIFTNELTDMVETDPKAPFLLYLNRVSQLDRLSRMQYLDQKTYLPGDILTKVDRMSMLVSLEARVPLLDHHLVEFAATIPPELKIKNSETKYLLKKIAEKFLPLEVIYRPKQGFAVPIAKWIRGEWKDMSRDLVLGSRPIQRGIFRTDFLRHIMEEHYRSRRDHSYIIWTLMVIELWFREMID